MKCSKAGEHGGHRFDVSGRVSSRVSDRFFADVNGEVVSLGPRMCVVWSLLGHSKNYF